MPDIDDMACRRLLAPIDRPCAISYVATAHRGNVALDMNIHGGRVVTTSRERYGAGFGESHLDIDQLRRFDFERFIIAGWRWDAFIGLLSYEADKPCLGQLYISAPVSSCANSAGA